MNPSHDDRLVQRYLDGELPAAESAELAARLLSDAALQERVREAEGMQRAFAAARSGQREAPAGFAANVLAAVRRLPSRELLKQAELVDGALRVCRRLLVAAALLAALGLAWHSGILDRARASTLEAAPDEVQMEMDRLDALILAGRDADGVPQRGR